MQPKDSKYRCTGLKVAGPVVSGCSLCAARCRVWVYRPLWRRLRARHGRWLLDVSEGHSLAFADVASLAPELARAQHRWRLAARAAEAAGAAPGEVFALARAVVRRYVAQRGVRRVLRRSR